MFTCPSAVPLILPGHWTTWGKRHFLLKNLSYFYLTYSCCFDNWAAFSSQKYFTHAWVFRAHPPCINIIFFFSHFISSSCYISPAATIDPIQSNMNEFRWHLIINLLDESGLCLSPIRSLEKTSEACSRWSCPLEVSLFAVIERVGSYSPDWVLGSIQAAAVNEPRCSLLCHAGVSGSAYTLLLFYLPVFLHGIGRGIGKQFGPMKPEASVCPMCAVAMADMLT